MVDTLPTKSCHISIKKNSNQNCWNMFGILKTNYIFAEHINGVDRYPMQKQPMEVRPNCVLLNDSNGSSGNLLPTINLIERTQLSKRSEKDYPLGGRG
jgi:hypothetical protein